MTQHPLTPRSSDPTPAEWSRSQSLDRPGEGGWPTASETEEAFNWRKYASAVIRYKWIVLFSAVLGVGAAYLSWQREVTGEYLAIGALWLQPEGTEQGPIVTEGLLQANSWVDLIRSYAVLDTVVMKEKLYLTPKPGEKGLFQTFTISESVRTGAYVLTVSQDGAGVVLTRGGEEVARARPGEMLGAGLGFMWTPPADSLQPGREIAFQLNTPHNAAAQLQTELVPAITGSIIRLSLKGKDPDRMFATMNGVLDRHVQLAADLKSTHIRQQTAKLEEQVAIAKADLDNATRALEQFRVRTVTEPGEQTAIQPGLAETRGPVFSQYFEMRLKQDDLERDRQKILAALEMPADSTFPVEAIELIPSVRSSSQLMQAIDALVAARLERQSLMDRYTAEHASVMEVNQKIRNFEQSMIPNLLRGLAGELEQEERSLGARIEASGQDLSAIPSRTIEEEGLRRSMNLSSAIYTELRQRYEFASLAQRSSLPDVQILDRAAVSQLPRTADRRAAVAIALFLLLVGAGMGGAVFADRMDPHMRTPDEVATVLGLNVLGVVPRIRPGSDHEESMDQAREAFRSLRTNVEFAYGSAGPIVVTVTSPGMSEGKTLVTSNLGMCFAELGRRTLIIDGDTRRGDLHRVLAGERKPGLTDYLRSKSTAEQVVQASAHPNLHFIGSGTQVANSPELLSSSRMGELLGELRRRYDVILVDSPPLGVGADALVLGCLSANMVLLFRSGSTHKDFAQARLEPLSRLPLRLLGAVLNDFQPDRLGSTYYHSYYGNYLPGYEAGAEDEEQEQLEGKPA